MNPQEFIESSPQNNILDVMNLPDEQRQLVNWITHQQKVTLSEVAVHLKISEELTQQHLQNLIEQGFIQELNASGLLHYQPLFSTQKKSKLPQNIWDKL
ncbi:MarR family transcriptional regulator [Fortiea sp. LEGE XX443]|uniref:MarR family transcriptional regulator n=1 Tax=Fortiea sp. LEGE XX443 TaxID=1828611 RepID=UPI00187E2061|nr:MarR family transcriptional regulator [Fortiea sp. LEGE XX443]MBE9006323.1 MarR family transcriptional regulator [Fortiea sp. LEGE XX443]